MGPQFDAVLSPETHFNCTGRVKKTSSPHFYANAISYSLYRPERAASIGSPEPQKQIKLSPEASFRPKFHQIVLPKAHSGKTVRFKWTPRTHYNVDVVS